MFIQVVCLGARAIVQASHWLIKAKNRDQSHATVHDILGEGTVTNGGLYSSTLVSLL
jgi:membrane protein required for beta-lactamase induction